MGDKRASQNRWRRELNARKKELRRHELVVNGENLPMRKRNRHLTGLARRVLTLSGSLPGQTSWTTIVVVAEKSMARTAQHSPDKYQNMVLVDPQGNKVHATIYNNDITAFQNTLILSKTYLISNATVRHTDPKYRPRTAPVQWTINGRTRIEEQDENHDALDNRSISPAVRTSTDEDYFAYIRATKRETGGVQKIVQTKYHSESCIQELVIINEK
ncbi:replication protein A 70 kDa DNA-binding subunit D-like [Forsythia ovata]|uniref:Replication protein A 70 kDa DNA-binding subunit D-like n=1 Tax=Forsythia ovata TaxID=205694 RepID=A0ABD1RLW4_9LAMI